MKVLSVIALLAVVPSIAMAQISATGAAGANASGGVALTSWRKAVLSTTDGRRELLGMKERFDPGHLSPEERITVNNTANRISQKLIRILERYSKESQLAVVLDSSNPSHLYTQQKQFVLFGKLDLTGVPDITATIVRLYDHQTVRGEQGGFTTHEVVALLHSGVEPGLLASLIREEGVDFSLNEQVTHSILEAGGDVQLLQAITGAQNRIRIGLSLWVQDGTAVESCREVSNVRLSALPFLFCVGGGFYRCGFRISHLHVCRGR